ncbi:MAG: TetR/AcrR family transcriptional regulator [Steroidobacteraceae bacterium]
MSRGSEGTRQKILDAAEKLFAKRGFHGVSIRNITKMAGVDVALANYHFGPKKDLLAAVLERRAQLLNDERLHMLAQAKQSAAPKAADAEAIINAFTYPLNNKSARGGPGWKSYFALVAQINNSPEWGGIMMSQYFDHVVHVFIDALREVFPDCPERELYWAYHFLSGALTLTFAETRRVDNLSGGLCKSTDLDAVHERLVPFCVGGFKALCERPRKKAQRRHASRA